MTNKEAIEKLKGILEEATEYENSVCYVTEEDREPLKMAIKALEQEPCEDAISRQAVLAIAGDSCLDLDSYEDTKEFCDEIKELPSVTPQSKMGRWIGHFDESGKWYECDQCHTDWGGSVNYCPNCGAKMGSEDKK